MYFLEAVTFPTLFSMLPSSNGYKTHASELTSNIAGSSTINIPTAMSITQKTNANKIDTNAAESEADTTPGEKETTMKAS